jgi:hypothetical protein
MWYTHNATLMRLNLREYKDTPPRVREIWDKVKYAETVHLPAEFERYFVNLADKPNWEWERTWGGMYTLPPTEVPCAHCGKKWTLATSNDCRIMPSHHADDYEYPADASVIGKTLAEVRELIRTTPDKSAHLTMYIHKVLRSDRFVDPALMEETHDGGTVLRNPNGYATANKQYADRYELVDWNLYVVQAGDVLIFTQERYIHPACMVERATANERAKMTTAIEAAGVKVHGSVVVPNNYSERGYAADWFIFDTDKGLFRIGWRRRVISVLKVQHGATSYEDNTFVKIPGSADIHCDTYAMLTDYFKAL